MHKDHDMYLNNEEEISNQMAQQMTSARSNRFVNSDFSELQRVNFRSISGYRQVPSMSLEEAVESIVPFVPDVTSYVNTAKEDCKRNTILTVNESAAIYLYTMPEPSFNENLNKALRAENPHALEPWFPFLKLFLTAVGKLPSHSTTIWRGVRGNIGSNFVKDHVHTWRSVNSCSSKLNVAGMFAGEKGTLFCIDAIRAKDIARYAVNKDEEELILMPGTRLRVKFTEFDVFGFSIVHLDECYAIPEGKHVMLSYHSISKDIVSKICQILQDEHIPVWFDEQGDMKNNMYDSLADGVENAAIICCFMTSDYEKSENCQLELQYAQKRHKQIIPCILTDANEWKPSGWLKLIVRDLEPIEFHYVFESPTMQTKVGDLINRIEDQLPASQYLPSQRVDQPSYLFELIRYEYKRNSRIERFINPAKSFPIEQSYINLAIIETKEQQEKEKKLRDTQHNDAINGTFEDIYGTKTPIDVKDIFEKCKDKSKQVLVFGRAGIGKSTFCQYAANQWANHLIWSQYKLVILLPLRNLTEDRYPKLRPGSRYTPTDLVQTEYFPYYDLSEKDKQLLRDQVSKTDVLWLLDGYDEIGQNLPAYLKDLIEQLRKNTHHILTSRPYMNTLSYAIQMEITGFTDENIIKYVKQFFDQIQDSLKDASFEGQKLLSFLKSNPSIWGVVHIPVNLELICSLWSDKNWSQTKALTITTLYDNITEWLCRRYLTKQDPNKKNMVKEEVYEDCKNELTFLATLAYLGMENNSIILEPDLLRKAETKSNWSLKNHPELLNIGILKPLNDQAIGNYNDREKDHYFIHLSFQEYFAARYLVTALNGSATQTSIEFIQRHKYIQRFGLLLSFASGLLSASNNMNCIDTFWNTILEEPLDLVGIRHMQIIISCMEEASNNKNFKRCNGIMNQITRYVKYAVNSRHPEIHAYSKDSLRRSPSLVNENQLIETFTILLQTNDENTKQNTISLIADLPIFNSTPHFSQLLVTALTDANDAVRGDACKALGRIGEKAATKEMIGGLLTQLTDGNYYCGQQAHKALVQIGKKTATKDVVAALMIARRDENDSVRSAAGDALISIAEEAAMLDVIRALMTDPDNGVRLNACKALSRIDEKAPMNDMIGVLVTALMDANGFVRSRACIALGRIGEKAATKDIIGALVTALGNADRHVRYEASEALVRIGDKLATKDVVEALVIALRDTTDYVRYEACEALSRLGEKAATKDVIGWLVILLGDSNHDVRIEACKALGGLGEKAATKDVIEALRIALEHPNDYVRRKASEAFVRIGERAATKDVIEALVTALGDANHYVRQNACEALFGIGEKAAMKEMITALVTALGNTMAHVRLEACKVLGLIGEKAATMDMIEALVIALRDGNDSVRREACKALGRSGERAGTKNVTGALLSALGDANDDVRHEAREAFGLIGEKAATKDVIEVLVTAVADANDDVRRRACVALGRVGEKAATNDMIRALVTALVDANDDVRRRACVALGRIGEKAVTKDMIEGLVAALKDGNHHLRRNACEALGGIGKKAATKDVIEALKTALRDADDDVKIEACEALGQMGEKAATNDVIESVMTTLRDANEDVRRRACVTLGRIGEKAATTNVIGSLVVLLGNMNQYVRLEACKALGRLGEKAVTKDVIEALRIALEDPNDYVRRKACVALGRISQKAPTKDVIGALAKAMGNGNYHVRQNACKAVGRISGKIAMKDLIEALVVALGDANRDVRREAGEALCQIGEKGATYDVIEALVTAVVDANAHVSRVSYKALDEVDEEAAGKDVMGPLLNALGYTNDHVRRKACEALAEMCEKAATNEVISVLVSAVEDANDAVSCAAFYTHRETGKKADTNEVISVLVSTVGDANDAVRCAAGCTLHETGEKASTNDVVEAREYLHRGARFGALKTLRLLSKKTPSSSVINALLLISDKRNIGEELQQFFVSSSSLSCIDSYTVSNLFMFLDSGYRWCLENVPLKKMIMAFLDTKMCEWCRMIARHSLCTGCAVTIVKQTIIMYDKYETVPFFIQNSTLRDELVRAFANQRAGLLVR